MGHLLNISYTNLKMKHLAAYALLVLGGKENPTADDVNNLLKDAGCNSDSGKVDALVKAMEGKNFAEQCASGLEKIAGMGSGPAAGGAAAAGATAAAAEVKEEVKEEEEDVDMGGLFGDDDDDY